MKAAVLNFQSLASQAKKRMKQGFWETCKKTSEQGYRHKIQNDEFVLTKEEEPYLAKVKQILNQEVVLNPIGQLMDIKHFENLTDEEKQVYVFKLARIYRSLKCKLR